MTMILEECAIDGKIKNHSWVDVKKAIMNRLKMLVQEMSAQSPCLFVAGEPFDERYERILHTIENFEKPPFTLQRICELLLDQAYYKSLEKFLLAISKTIEGITISDGDLSLDPDPMRLPLLFSSNSWSSWMILSPSG